MFGEKHKKRSKDLLLQNISRLDSFLKKLGMKCNSETLHRMWRYSGKNMDNVQIAVEYMLCCHKEKLERSESIFDKCKGITSPIGWLHDCLKYGRYIDYEETINLPYFDSILALSNAVKNMVVKI